MTKFLSARYVLVLFTVSIAVVGSWALYRSAAEKQAAGGRQGSERDEPRASQPTLKGHRVTVEKRTPGRRPPFGLRGESSEQPSRSSPTVSMSVSLKGLRSRQKGDAYVPREIRLELVPDGRDGESILVRIYPESGGDQPALVELPPADWFTVESLVIDGWNSSQMVEGDGRLIPDEDGHIALPVILPMKTVLVVRANGAPVPGALVHEQTGPDTLAMAAMFPSFPELSRARFRADGDGRVVLSRKAGAATWWVGGPGLAWKRVRVPPSTPSLVVSLEGGGAISLEVEPCAGEERLVARLFLVSAEQPRPIEDPAALVSGNGLASVPLRADCTLELRGLLAGDWLVTVTSLGLEPGGEVTWTLVTVHAGGSERITLDAPASRSLDKATYEVVGQVRVPEGWGEPHSLWLETDGDGGPTMAVLTPSKIAGLWTFQGQRLPAGRYCATVQPLGWSTAVEIPGPPGGLDLSVPPARKIAVRVLDRSTRQRVPAALVRIAQRDWRPGTLGGIHWGPKREIGKAAMEGGYLATVARGPTRIVVEAEGYLEASVEISITESSPERFEVALDRGGEVMVRVTRAGATSDEIEGVVVLTSADDSRVWFIDVDQGAGALGGLAPGSYRAEWRPSTQEAPQPPWVEEFVIRPGRPTHLEFRE